MNTDIFVIIIIVIIVNYNKHETCNNNSSSFLEYCPIIQRDNWTIIELL